MQEDVTTLSGNVAQMTIIHHNLQRQINSIQVWQQTLIEELVSNGVLAEHARSVQERKLHFMWCSLLHCVNNSIFNRRNIMLKSENDKRYRGFWRESKFIFVFEAMENYNKISKTCYGLMSFVYWQVLFL